MSGGWHACSRDTYVLADMYSAQQYEMAVGSHTCSRNTYMSANTYPVQEYEMLFGPHAFSEVTYILAHTHIAPIVFLGQSALCSLNIYPGRDWLVCYLHIDYIYDN